MTAGAEPVVSVIILNYNGRPWLERCLASLRDQTISGSLEIIVADNASSDGSDRLAEALLRGWPNTRLLPHGANLGYCEGNNRAARVARGRWLFFLNNDTWLERDCLEKLLAEVGARQAAAATPRVLDYDDDTFQSLGAAGYDVFGLPSTRRPHADTRNVLMPEGCGYLIARSLFEQLGGFDAELFMYSDELDLSWRVWISGHEAIAVPAARLHHRGAVHANPRGEAKVVELRTSDRKRFYANRNGLLVLLKNARGFLLLLVPLQLALLACEALAGLVLVRRWSFVRRAYLDAAADCWRLRPHIRAERRRIRQLRRRGDAWMLRFLCWRPNRLDELRRVFRLGLPKVTPG